MDVHDAIRLLSHSGGDSIKPHRTTVEALDDGLDHLPVHLVQSQPVHLQKLESVQRDR